MTLVFVNCTRREIEKKKKSQCIVQWGIGEQWLKETRESVFPEDGELSEEGGAVY